MQTTWEKNWIVIKYSLQESLVDTGMYIPLIGMITLVIVYWGWRKFGYK
jgi:hypothetical protein